MGFTAVLDGGKSLPLGIVQGGRLWHVRLHRRHHVNVRLSLLGSVGSETIGGVQPRYLLPIVPSAFAPRGSSKLASSRFSRTVVPIVAISIVSLRRRLHVADADQTILLVERRRIKDEHQG